MQYYVVIDGRREGPFAVEELGARGLEHHTLVWFPGQLEWVRADEVPALRELLATLPPPVPGGDRRPDPDYTPWTFQTLYLWWLSLLAASLILPALGGLCFLAAESQRVAIRHPQGWVYYRYTAGAQVLQLGGGGMLTLGGAAALAAIAVFTVTLYKLWNLIQDGYARTTPEWAVAFLFIPFFNLYWVFIAVAGLADDLNHYPRRHRGPMDMPALPTDLAVAWCVLLIASLIPLVQFIAVLPMAVILVILMTRFRNAAVTLLKARQPPEAPPEPLPQQGAVAYSGQQGLSSGGV